ncbi:MAG: flagellar hook-associated protein FlgK [Balneolaceae bacterium]
MRALFEISKSGLRAAERSLSVTANNVVNADTPGYSRQRVDKNAIGMQMGNYHSGLGVNITAVNRLRNEMNDVLLNEKRQDMGYLKEQQRIFQQLEATMASDSGGDLDLRIGRFFDLFSELSSDPQDMSVRNNLVSEAVQLTDKMAEIDRSLDRTSDLVRDTTTKSVQAVNELLRDLAAINRTVQQAEAQGKPDHASLDLQVKKLEELAELVDFETQRTENGGMLIRVGGVQVLDENQAYFLKPEVDDVEKAYRLRLESGKLVETTGGKLGAGIEMYEEQIQGLKEKLDTIAETMVTEFNTLHRSGFGLEDSMSRDFFDPAGDRAGTIRVRDEIRDSVEHIAASSTDGEAGNGEIAAEIASLRNSPLIGGQKLIDYSINLISEPGRNLSDLNSKIEARDSEIQMLTMQQERESGVNIDEELSLMIQYQNAYQGSARVMGAAQQMLDTLIDLVR